MPRIPCLAPALFAFLHLPCLCLCVRCLQLMGYDVGTAPVWAPMLAVGTSAGSIYVLSHEKLVVYAKLSGAHTKAVTALQPLGSERPGGADMLLSAAADGTVAGGWLCAQGTVWGKV